MGALISSYLSKAKLEMLLQECNSRSSNGIPITISVNDTADQYGNNIWGYISQSKEESEARKPRVTVLNGNVVWNDGKITTIKRERPSSDVAHVPAATTQAASTTPPAGGDGPELPF